MSAIAIPLNGKQVIHGIQMAEMEWHCACRVVNLYAHTHLRRPCSVIVNCGGCGQATLVPVRA